MVCWQNRVAHENLGLDRFGHEGMVVGRVDGCRERAIWVVCVATIYCSCM